MKERIAIVIPTRNEAGVIRILVRKLNFLSPKKIIFADSSMDGTDQIIKEVSKEYPSVQLTKVEKLGLGNGLRSGLAEALASEVPLIITMDADLSHDPKDIPRLIHKAGEADVVVASRYLPGGKIIGWGPGRKAISAAANAISHRVLGIPVRDCSTGFRSYRRAVIERILPLSVEEGYAVQSEFLILAHRLGYSIVEIPAIFVNRKRGKSKLGANEVFRFLAFTARMFRMSRNLATRT